MTSPKMAAKRERDNRLYAMLLVEEYEDRLYCPEDTTLAAIDVRRFTYLAFLRAQATYTKSSRGWCYALALRQITGG